MIARADLLELLVVGLHRELPEQVIGQRAGGRERVLDRRQFLDLRRRPRPVAVVQIVAEEVLVVGVVPRVGLLGGLLGLRLFGLLLLGGLELLGLDFLEERVLDHLLIQQISELERGHRQQLDGLLQRRRQNELLNEFCVQFLLNRHGSRAWLSPYNLSPIGSRHRGKSASPPRLRPGRPACRCGRSRHRERCRRGR